MPKKELVKDFDYAILILRITLGAFFVIAGLSQILNINGFANSVSGFAIVNQSVKIVSLAGVLLPWIELILGLMLCFGLATSLVGVLVAFLSFVFAAANGFVDGSSLVKEVLFVAVGLALMLLGGGSLSLDAQIRAGAGKSTQKMRKL